MGRFQPGLGLGRQGSEPPAPDRFHDHDRDVPLLELFVLRLGGAVEPVEVVQLDLGEIPVAVVGEGSKVFRFRVAGEAEVADFAQPLLFGEVLDTAGVDVLLVGGVEDAVDQVEVDVVGLEAGQLLLKDLFVVGVGLDEVFGREAVAVAGVFLHRVAEEFLRLAAVVDVGGVVVVDPALHQLVDHLGSSCVVDRRARRVPFGRQAHVPHPQAGEGDGFVGFGFHGWVLLCFGSLFFYHFLGAAHASLSAAKLWSASEVRQVNAWEGALPLPFPRFFEKNRVKLFIFYLFLFLKIPNLILISIRLFI